MGNLKTNLNIFLYMKIQILSKIHSYRAADATPPQVFPLEPGQQISNLEVGKTFVRR